MIVVIDLGLIYLHLHRTNSAYSEHHDPGPRSTYHKGLMAYASSAKRAGCRLRSTRDTAEGVILPRLQRTHLLQIAV